MGTPPGASDTGGTGNTLIGDLLGPMQALFQSYNTDSNPYDVYQGNGMSSNGAWNGMINPTFIGGGAIAPGYGGGQHMHPPNFMALMAGTWHNHITNRLFRLFGTPQATFFAATEPAHGAMAPQGADSLNGLITFMLALAAGIAPPFHGTGGT